MENTKIFSVVVPVYNAERTIERTLASFLSNRDYIKEVLVIDDHCTDKTLQIVESFASLLPIKIYESIGEHNTGLARKTGILKATGEWLAFIDADDCLVHSSLQYIYQQIQQYDYVYLVKTFTVFYEWGVFDIDRISVNEGSCGGTYYKREFLIENNLFPHDQLKLSEDEYFNYKIMTFIEHSLHESKRILRYPYPTYEVHHDPGDTSLSARDWLNYSIYWHFECQKYLTQEYLQLLTAQDIDWIEIEYIKNFLMCYFILLCAYAVDDFSDEDLNKCFKDFQSALEFYCDTFDASPIDMMEYYNQNWDMVKQICQVAKKTCRGVNPPVYQLSFCDFLMQLRGEIA